MDYTCSWVNSPPEIYSGEEVSMLNLKGLPEYIQKCNSWFGYTTSFTQNKLIKIKIWWLKKLKAIVTCSDQTEIRFFHHDLCPNVNFNIWINTRKANLIYCQLKQIKSLRSKSKLKQHIPFLLPSLLRLNFTLWTPNFSVSPCLRQHSKVEYGHCSQSVTASSCCYIMGPLHRLQSFSKACSGMDPLHGPQFLQKNLHLLTALWSAGKILPLFLSRWCSEDCFTFFLTPLCHEHFALS